MSLLSWLLLALAVLLFAHRAVCRLLPQYLLQRLRQRVDCPLPQHTARQLLPPPLSSLLPPWLLSSPLLAAVSLSAGSSVQLHWPLSSGLRSVTLLIQQPLFDATLAAVSPSSAQPREAARAAPSNGAGLHPSGGDDSRAQSRKKAQRAPMAISSFHAVLLRWFNVTVVVQDARGKLSAVSCSCRYSSAARLSPVLSTSSSASPLLLCCLCGRLVTSSSCTCRRCACSTAGTSRPAEAVWCAASTWASPRRGSPALSSLPDASSPRRRCSAGRCRCRCCCRSIACPLCWSCPLLLHPALHRRRRRGPARLPWPLQCAGCTHRAWQS